MRRRQFLITTGTAAVGIIAGPRPSLAQLAIPQAVDKQIFDWVREPGGLLDWLNDLGEQQDPANSTPRADLGGLTLIEHSRAQMQLWNLVRGGGIIEKRHFGDHMVIVAEELRNSYNRAPESEWSKLQTNLTRTHMRDLLNQLLQIAERPIIAPVLRPVPPRAIGRSSGTQYALPTSDNSNNWKQECAGDANANAWEELDEGFGAGRGSGSGPDDATTAWVSNGGPINESLIMNLSSVTDPTSSANHIYRGRSVKATTSCSTIATGSQIDVTMRLLENGTQRATQTFTDINDTWTTRAVTLTAGEADAITNYGLLQIDTQANKVGGGTPRAAIESAHEFECPDAGAAADTQLLFQPF